MVNKNQQTGFVSIMVVIFFVLLASVLTIGFARLVQMGQQQALADQESKLAYQSAQAGIEDAKRAITYCANNNMADCNQLFDDKCPGFYANNRFSSLGLSADSQDAIHVGDQRVNQRYTCVVINDLIDRYWGELDPSSSGHKSILLPLKSDKSFDRAVISWGMKVAGGSYNFPSSGAASKNPPKSQWVSQNWPAMMRIMLIEVPSGSMYPSDIINQSSFLAPSFGSGDTTVLAQDLPVREIVKCSNGGSTNYACNVTLDLSGKSMITNDYYLELTPLYRKTDFEVKLYNGALNRQIKSSFYTIDAVGAVENTYRRVQVMIGPANVVSPSDALQTGKTICKDFWVTGYYNSYQAGDSC
ncbi:MAG TPA: hypothetical protein VFG56_01940 [Candidatus Saccharimonadales bacterium]|nr:hypothetical protein [Candidatus Saccharimonadales bacterium]